MKKDRDINRERSKNSLMNQRVFESVSSLFI
nr:MAG TPA: hypothetical protein [Caudoviricetes sp.]